MSNVHCQHTPTTIAIAAVHWAFQVHGTAWRTRPPGGDGDQKIPVWEHYRRVGALSASGVLEPVAMDDVEGAHAAARGACSVCPRSRIAAARPQLQLVHLRQ